MEIFDDWLKAMLTALLHSQVHTKQYYIHVYIYTGPEQRVVGHYRRRKQKEFIVYLTTLAVSG
jgi:hypothetical protein